MDACVAISSPWNVGVVAKNFHDNYIIRKAILEEQQDIVRLHMHEEHFMKVIRDRDVDLGTHLIFLKFREAVDCDLP